jgi:hypothetical protein
MDDSDIQTAEEFTYGSTVSAEGRGALKHTISCINNANGASIQFHPMWTATYLSKQTKSKTFLTAMTCL